MGYIKKLKNNELVGGTDKHTIYPVTSAEAVFEEVSDNEFKSQKYLNNHITNERIVDNTIENRKLKDDTIDMGKLNTQLKTTIQNAYDASWKVKEEPFSLETKYDANDVVYDPDTNSSYVSLTADNQGNPVKLEDEEAVNPYWRLVINGISAIQATEEIEATKDELIDYIQENLKDHVDDEIADAESRVASAEEYAQGVIAEAEQTARSISGIVYQTVAATPNYTDTIPVQNKAVTAQIGYYTCSGGSGATITVDDADAAAFTPIKGGQVKILMTEKSAVTSGNVQLQFGSVTATKKVLLYNEETVSSSNTWELGEVISVYYDGTKYHASNAQGGSNKKIDAYLYGDLRTLAVGQNYEIDESVKTIDKQFRKITKEIKTLSLSETITSGVLKVSGNATYRAASAISTYNPSTTYTEGAYALGSMTIYTLTVTAESVTAGNITVNGTAVAIEATDDAASIASKIAAALVIDGWTDSASGNVVTVRCNTIGNNTTSITIIDTDSTGVVVSSSSVAGTDVIRKYDGESWADATPSGMIEDGILVSVDGAWLLTNATTQNSVTKDISAAVIYEEDINISAIPNVYCGMFYNQSKWWWTNSNNHGKFLPVNAGEVYTIVANGSREVNCGLFKDNTHVEGEVTNFATGETGRVINPNNSITITVPSDAKYLYFRTTASGSVDRTPSRISILHNFHYFRAECEENFDDLYDKVDVNETNIKSAQEFPSFTITDRTPINLANYQQQNCSFGANNKWYYTQQAGRHKAIPVSPGDQFIIKSSVTSYIGWLTNYYNPPYKNGADVPWVTGRGREEINQQMIIEAPTGASWLIVTTRDGSGVNVNWSIDKCNATNKELGFLKFRYASWNIGHFSYYDGSEGTYNPTIPANKVEEMSIRYKRIINDVSADVFGVAEYDPYFDANSTISAASKIFPCYGGQFIGAKYSYNCNAIFTNNNKFLNASTGGVTFIPSQAGQTRYYKWVRCFLSGIEVYIVSTHLDFSPSEYRVAQIETLITRFSTCPHVIISGDFNTNVNAEADMQLFIDAGYTLANGGYIGYSNTSRDNYPLDHICVKGFRMDNIQVNEESWTLSDHKLISCDLTLL